MKRQELKDAIVDAINDNGTTIITSAEDAEAAAERVLTELNLDWLLGWCDAMTRSERGTNP